MASEFRPGRSLVALGGALSIPIAAGATVNVPIPVLEAGQLGQLNITVWDAPNAQDITASCQVTDITLNNDLLLSTSANAATFSDLSTLSPLFGHIVQVNDALAVTVVSNSATPGVVQVSFTTI